MKIWMRRLSILIAAVLICLCMPSAAFAHSKMAKSVPAEGGTAKAGLSEITLGFSKPVRVMLIKVKNVAVNSGVEAGFKPAASYATSLAFKVAPLQPGRYQVNWSAVAKDGHVMRGTLSFRVAD